MLTVVRQDGTEYRLEDESIRIVDFVIESPEADIENTILDGVDGYIDHGTYYPGRRMTLTASVFTEDPVIGRNKLFKIFDSKKPFYIIDDREPHRRWRCKVDGGFVPERLSNYLTKFEVPLVSDFTYAESLKSSLEEDEAAYTFNTKTFTVVNKSDIVIDPRLAKTPLVIKFEGESTYMEIANVDTGDIWIYNGITKKSDTITLDGVRSLKNDVSIFRDTNMRLLRLRPGSNNFEIKNAGDKFTITFDFRTYTL